MATLYSIKYAGQTGTGAGAMYVGNGIVAGFDIDGGRYKGTYSEQGERFKANIELSIPNGGHIVTGLRVPAGVKI